jgi:hypothetical protein
MPVREHAELRILMQTHVVNPIPVFDLMGCPEMLHVANRLLIAGTMISLRFTLLSRDSNGMIFVGCVPNKIILLN